VHFSIAPRVSRLAFGRDGRAVQIDLRPNNVELRPWLRSFRTAASITDRDSVKR
jgi:hypothetical protein